MASWGGLNPALTAWRTGLNQRFPNRGTGSDGGYADKLHGSSSQHQADTDGTVDAFDQDVNVFGSRNETGTDEERRIIEALKADFVRDPRSHLWIHQRQICNRDIGPFRVRDYFGSNPHDKHAHWESRQSHEKNGSPWPMPNTDRLLAELKGDDVTKTEFMQWMTEWAKSSAGKDALARALLTADGIIPAPPGSVNADKTPNTHWTGASYLQWTYRHAQDARAFADNAVKQIGALSVDMPAGAVVDEATLRRALVAALRDLANPAA